MLPLGWLVEHRHRVPTNVWAQVGVPHVHFHAGVPELLLDGLQPSPGRRVSASCAACAGVSRKWPSDRVARGPPRVPLMGLRQRPP
jgi:hypothetical protein